MNMPARKKTVTKPAVRTKKPSPKKASPRAKNTPKRASKKAHSAPAARKDHNARALALHKKLGGKLRITSSHSLKKRDDWNLLYTPGVGAVSSYLAKHPEDARRYTIKRNTVAVVSDGSAVLGLGNLGAIAALPVMEGKCAIFKETAGIDAFPLVLDTQDTEEIIKIVTAIAPTFGGINLEDISAPRCFEIEERLRDTLDIPVMHDDQHGTAIVVLAGLINAAKVVRKSLSSLKVVVIGAGAAGSAIAHLLLRADVRDIIVTDSTGTLYEGRPKLSVYKEELAEQTNPRHVTHITDAVEGSDVIIGVSGPGTISADHIKTMAPRAIVFALANPVPEIMPDVAKRAGAAVIATGRSDFPNQINNALVFPGIFRGALDAGARKITEDMKVAAAHAIAKLVQRPTANAIVPSVTDPRLVPAVSRAVRAKA